MNVVRALVFVVTIAIFLIPTMLCLLARRHKNDKAVAFEGESK